MTITVFIRYQLDPFKLAEFEDYARAWLDIIPKCGGDLIEIRPKKKGGKTFYGCSNWNNETIKCEFKLWQKPILEACPQCAAKFLVYGGSRAKPMIVCADKQCGYKRSAEPVGEGDTVAEPLVASAMVAPAT